MASFWITIALGVIGAVVLWIGCSRDLDRVEY